MQGFDDFFDDIWNHLKLNAEQLECNLKMTL